jgi:excisionase family DNA binding protein
MESKVMSSQAVAARLLSFKQAAEYLGTSVWMLRQLEWQGKLPSVRGLGKKILFDISDLDALVMQKKQNSSTHSCLP